MTQLYVPSSLSYTEHTQALQLQSLHQSPDRFCSHQSQLRHERHWCRQTGYADHPVFTGKLQQGRLLDNMALSLSESEQADGVMNCVLK